MNTFTSNQTYIPKFIPKNEPRAERRNSRRTQLSEIVYMNLYPENGAIILDFSSSGAGFRAATPVSTGRQVRFRLLEAGIDQIEITGDLIWLDETRTKGGLQFRNIPAEVRKRIRQWTGEPETLLAETNDRADAADSDAQALNQSGTEDKSWPIEPTLPRKENPILSLPNPMRRRTSVLGLDDAGESGNAGKGDRRVGAIALAVSLSLVIALIVLSGIIGFPDKRKVGESLIRLGQYLTGEYQEPVNSQNVASIGGVPETNIVPPPAPISEPSGASEASPAPLSDITAPPQQEPVSAPLPPAISKEPKIVHADSGPPERGQSGHAEFALAQRYMNGAGVPENREVAAHLLWEAVGQGNTQAELQLADLYLHGEGVPKQCNQARILLNAASDSGNVSAGQKLTELGSYGCR